MARAKRIKAPLLFNRPKVDYSGFGPHVKDGRRAQRRDRKQAEKNWKREHDEY